MKIYAHLVNPIYQLVNYLNHLLVHTIARSGETYQQYSVGNVTNTAAGYTLATGYCFLTHHVHTTLGSLLTM